MKNEIIGLKRGALRTRMHEGHPIDPAALADSRYRGTSLGLPGWMERLSWKTFRKSFWRDPESGSLLGWNTRVLQEGNESPTTPLRSQAGHALTFGPYEVVQGDQEALPEGLEHCLLIDYGRGRGSPLSPLRLLRDPIVALVPGSAELLLGWSYLRLGFRLATPSYFLLEREGNLDGIQPPWFIERQASSPLPLSQT